MTLGCDSARRASPGAAQPRQSWAWAAMLFTVAVLVGCGVGAGASADGEANLTVTRDFGAELLLSASQKDLASSETVVRFLDREAEIETSFGGNFIDSIEGVSGGSEDGRRSDWFFYVNGYWSPVGAAEARVRPGDRIWWDYRDWEAAFRVPAVVGSWPEPFASGLDGVRFPTMVECAADSAVCDSVAERLTEAGADLSAAGDRSGDPVSGAQASAGGSSSGAGASDQLRVLVGPWDAVQADPAAKLISRGPALSGVYAEFEQTGRSWELVGLDAAGRERVRLGAGSGLVAAVRVGEDEPTWLVTGADEAGVQAAASLLSAETLRDRYAVASDPQTQVGGDPIDRPGSASNETAAGKAGAAIPLPILEPRSER